MLLETKLACQAAAKALQPALDAANAACGAFTPGDASDEALAAFCAAVNAMREQYYAANGYTRQFREPVGFTKGKKNARITEYNENGEPRSVYCFVDLATGNILKSAGWSAPAKGARGNIINGAAQVGPHGAAYLR